MSALTKRRKVTKFNPDAIKGGRLQVPRTALRFAAEVQFSDEPSGDENVIPVSIVARSGNALQHFWFGKCIHDLEGMRPASAKLPFDYCHDDREVLGFSDSQEVTDAGLVMHGALIPFKKNDRVDEVVSKANNGFEWQASIYFDIDELVLEFVPEGESVEVNGQDFEGPGVIFREWMLRGAAICPYGYDPNTSVQLSSSGDDEIAIHVLETPIVAKKPAKKTQLNKPAPNRHERRKATSLAAKKNAKPNGKIAAVKPAAKPAKSAAKLAADEDDEGDDEGEQDADAEEMDADDEGDGDETEGDCDCEGEEDCDCDDDDDVGEEDEELDADDDEAGKHSAKKRKGKLSPAQREAKRFVNAFGDIGGRWYAEGLSFEQAQVKFNKQTRKENARLQKQVDDQSAQLSALRGEEEPVSGGADSGGNDRVATNGLSGGLAKFAATLKMPKH